MIRHPWDPHLIKNVKDNIVFLTQKVVNSVHTLLQCFLKAWNDQVTFAEKAFKGTVVIGHSHPCMECHLQCCILQSPKINYISVVRKKVDILIRYFTFTDWHCGVWCYKPFVVYCNLRRMGWFSHHGRFYDWNLSGQLIWFLYF